MAAEQLLSVAKARHKAALAALRGAVLTKLALKAANFEHVSRGAAGGSIRSFFTFTVGIMRGSPTVRTPDVAAKASSTTASGYRRAVAAPDELEQRLQPHDSGNLPEDAHVEAPSAEHGPPLQAPRTELAPHYGIRMAEGASTVTRPRSPRSAVSEQPMRRQGPRVRTARDPAVREPQQSGPAADMQSLDADSLDAEVLCDADGKPLFSSLLGVLRSAEGIRQFMDCLGRGT